MRRAALVLALLLSVACGEPPDKEMQQAQGAIDAARAAGADIYAHDEFAAAEASLKNAQDAVGQRDYRLALTYALDSRERAQNAAKEASDQKGAARTDADKLIGSTTTALAAARAKLKTAEAARAPTRTLGDARRTLAGVDSALQEARADFAKGDYRAVTRELGPVGARLTVTTAALEGAHVPPPRRRR